MISKNYLEKVYAGFLAKCIGVRLGAPVEPSYWTYDTMKNLYGDIHGYVQNFKNFTADDDTNCPVFFIRSLEDYGKNRKITSEDIGNTWLNYISEGHGMIWWGGYDLSSAELVYINLKNGIKPPFSGSIRQNGIKFAEDIGGQIFIDSWGLVCPGNVKMAAEYAEMAAIVSHEGNGVYGGKFIAGCIAKAFTTDDIFEIIETGLSVVPEESEFMRVNKAVINYYNNNPNDFGACFKMLEENFGYEKYKGICPIISNAGIVTLSLLYGKGSISRSIEIAAMCGWDTDCNAGNVGTIVGVAYGLDNIEEHYRRPINDMLIVSSISGSLNIVDIPTFVKELTVLGYKLGNEKIPESLLSPVKKRDLYFDFGLPGSTHGLRVDAGGKIYELLNENQSSLSSSGNLKLTISDLSSDSDVKLFYKPFYRKEDFESDKYQPIFSPLVYPGQKLKIKYKAEKLSGERISISPYIRLTHSKNKLLGNSCIISSNEWDLFEWTIPDTDCEAIDEIGLIIENSSKSIYSGSFFIDSFHVFGKGKHFIDFSKEKEEFHCVTQFSYNRGKWSLEEGKLQGLCIDDADCYTGNYYTEDIYLQTEFAPKNGFSHMISFRTQGALKGYYAGFSKKNKVAFIKNDHGKSIVEEKDFSWDLDKVYKIELEAVKNHFIVKIDGQTIFDIYDNDDYFKYGMYGLGLLEKGRTLFNYLKVIEV
ncbi:MAG: ADP-ribosylglycohydrolase family protein [bacterium]|nr:ADP-ribosylglycohydrolase family protein [bacterium]